MKEIKRIDASDLISAYESEHRDCFPDRLYCCLHANGHLYFQPEYDDDPNWKYNPCHISDLRLSLSQLVKITNQFKNLLAFL